MVLRRIRGDGRGHRRHSGQLEEEVLQRIRAESRRVERHPTREFFQEVLKPMRADGGRVEWRPSRKFAERFLQPILYPIRADGRPVKRQPSPGPRREGSPVHSRRRWAWQSMAPHPFAQVRGSTRRRSQRRAPHIAKPGASVPHGWTVVTARDRPGVVGRPHSSGCPSSCPTHCQCAHQVARQFGRGLCSGQAQLPDSLI